MTCATTAVCLVLLAGIATTTNGFLQPLPSASTRLITLTPPTTSSMKQLKYAGTTRRQQQSALHASTSILSGTLDTIKTFSKSGSLLQSVTDRAVTTPPMAYFLALLASGCGIPVSEDALCVFAGAMLGQQQEQQRRLVLALYAGVVLSDFITFWIGRALRMGIFQPLANKWILEKEGDEEQIAAAAPNNNRQEKIHRVLQKWGNWVGFIIRFSIGTRGPLMLLTGFTNEVPFTKFAVGVMLGAACSLPLQLYAGYALGGSSNPAAVVGVVAGISSFVMTAAVAVVAMSWGALVLSQFQKMCRRRAAGAQQ